MIKENKEDENKNECGRNSNVIGYLINENIFFEACTGGLWHIDVKIKSHLFTNKVVLRKTTKRLLMYILVSYCNGIEKINVDNILYNVWDKYELQSSNQRLWQSVKLLNSHLENLGHREEFLFRVGKTLHMCKTTTIKQIYIE